MITMGVEGEVKKAYTSLKTVQLTFPEPKIAVR